MATRKWDFFFLSQEFRNIKQYITPTIHLRGIYKYPDYLPLSRFPKNQVSMAGEWGEGVKELNLGRRKLKYKAMYSLGRVDICSETTWNLYLQTFGRRYK